MSLGAGRLGVTPLGGAPGSAGAAAGANVAAADTLTTAGTVGRAATASLAAAVVLAAAGVVGVSGDSTVPATGSVTAAGALGSASGATAAAAVSITASGVATSGVGAVVAAVAAVTADGSAASDGDASLAAVAIVAGQGQVDAPAGSTTVATAALSAAGSVSLGTGTALAAAAAVYADGVIVGSGMSGGGAVAATASLTADGVVAVQTPTSLFWEGGRSRDGFGVAVWDPDVEPPPISVLVPFAVRKNAAHAFDSVDIVGNRAVVESRTVTHGRLRHRITVGGEDMTYKGGIETPFPSFGLVSPGLYGAGSITFPQFVGWAERTGHGRWKNLTKFAPVKIQLVDDTNHVVGDPIYKGLIADFDHSGRTLTCALAGELTGPAGWQDRPEPGWPQLRDIADLVIPTVQHELRLPTRDTGPTGIKITDSGGDSQMDWLSAVLAQSTMLDGRQWTLMPNDAGEYRLLRKDTETIDASVYLDDAHASGSLRRDFAEEPNRIYAKAMNPHGYVLDGMQYPGMTSAARGPYPGTLSPGDTGDAVTQLIWRLWNMGYLDGGDDAPFGFDWSTADDDPVTQAVKRLQAGADVFATPGVVNAATWDALYDLEVTSYNLRRARIKPYAQKPYTRAFRLSASGQILGPNPNYDRSKPPVDATINITDGRFTDTQLHNFSEHELADGDSPNWVGTITLPMGAVIAGEHNPGDPLTGTMLMDARRLQPGMNLWLPITDGGTLVHVSGVDFDDQGVATVAVDTRARDTMKVWEVIRRNRQSRIHPARQWQQRQRSSRFTTAMSGANQFFGRIDDRVFCPANQYTTFEVPAGEEGQILDVTIQTVDAPALYVVTLWGTQVGRGWLNDLNPNPLTKDGTKFWTEHETQLREQHFLLGQFGTKDQPCGYGDKQVDHSTTTATRTGTAQAAADTITITGHGYDDGQQVAFDGTHPDGIYATTYYVVDATSDTFKVASSPGGTPLDLTSDATGVVVTTQVPVPPPPVTGGWHDNGGLSYFCRDAPVITVGIWVDRDTHVQGGRVIRVQSNDQI